MMHTIFKRLKEPSTWASLAVLAGIFAPKYSAELRQVGEAVGTVAAIVGAALPEGPGVVGK